MRILTAVRRYAGPVVLALAGATALTGCGAVGGTGYCGPADLRWVYARDTDLRVYDVFTFRDGEEHRLTKDQKSFHPSISPDGERIVFTRGLGESQECCGFERTQLYTMNADGSDQQPLLDHDHDEAPAWSPKGDRIAFLRTTEGSDTYDLMTVSPDGGEPATLVADLPSGPGLTPVWSADGKSIAWASGERYLEWVTDGKRSKLDLGPAAPLGPPAWTADGTAFVVRLDSGGLTRVDVDSGERKPLKTSATLPALLPTGQIAVVRIDREANGKEPSDLVVMNDDGSDRETVGSVDVWFDYDGIKFSAARC